MKKVPFQLPNIYQNRTSDIVYLDADDNNTFYCSCSGKLDKATHLAYESPFDWVCSECHRGYLGPVLEKL